VHPVPPIFFLEVTRNRKAPFWSHPLLVPLVPDMDKPTSAASGDCVEHTPETDHCPALEDESEEESDSGWVDMGQDLLGGGRATFEERFREHIRTIKDFCDGLEYQVQFGDHRMLLALERDGVGFLRLAKNCLSRERRMRSTRGSTPTTWEKRTLNAIYYRTRPNAADVNS
jgi:hypothetical protein